MLEGLVLGNVLNNLFLNSLFSPQKSKPTRFVVNKAKGRISKRVFEESKEHRNTRKIRPFALLPMIYTNANRDCIVLKRMRGLGIH